MVLFLFLIQLGAMIIQQQKNIIGATSNCGLAIAAVLSFSSVFVFGCWGEACNEAAFMFASNLTSEKRLIASQDPDDEAV
jgi:hypothetical protein